MIATKNYVVVRLAESDKYRAWADHGDVAWGSPAYDVLGYFPTHKEARKFIKEQRDITKRSK